jgi:hypothetical protein
VHELREHERLQLIRRSPQGTQKARSTDRAFFVETTATEVTVPGRPAGDPGVERVRVRYAFIRADSDS